MKYVRFIVLLIIFIGIVVFITKNGAKEYTEENKVLRNGVVLEGTVSDIKRSDNHSFGILTVDVLHSTIKEFSKKSKQGIYPYQIRDKKAEIYLPIYIERQIGDHIQLISDRQIIYYKGKNTKDEGEVYIITNPSDVDFVKENSIFNTH
ncbi:hypothetical protein CLU96_0651 [Chryseobacterium sp. 52]|uniref:hypothetical protein n=1 Tax=Chryseobacterium sp. 52 TaxID=2035213 RepID=UPI000C19C4B8|nr:hypothetical protein [Chryseobacterium sp. 52]PIF43738.1 hypothetical protein CLU96_0651 [Chryseobacterium sp. 52]